MFLYSSYNNYNAVIPLNVASGDKIDRAMDRLGEDRAFKSELLEKFRTQNQPKRDYRRKRLQQSCYYVSNQSPSPTTPLFFSSFLIRFAFLMILFSILYHRPLFLFITSSAVSSVRQFTHPVLPMSSISSKSPDRLCTVLSKQQFMYVLLLNTLLIPYYRVDAI